MPNARTIFALSATGLAIGFFSAYGTPKAYAQPPEVIEARAAVEESLKKLEGTFQGTDETKETLARKVSLQAILALSRAETENVKKNLEELEGIPAELSTLKERSLRELTDYLAFIDREEEMLLMLEGKEATKKFAADLGTWRSTYTERVKGMFDLIYLSRSEQALKTAYSRLGKITLFLSETKLAKTQRTKWELLLNQAALDLRDARDIQLRARQRLLERTTVLRDKELNTASPQPGGEKGERAASGEIGDDRELTAAELIQQSIEEIRNAYGIFIRIAKEFQKSQP